MNKLLIVIGLFLCSGVANSAEARLGIGLGYNANVGARYQEVMLTSSDRHWYFALTNIGNDERYNYQYLRYTAGYRFNWGKETKFSPYLRLGVAYFDEEPFDYISDKTAFDVAIGFRLWNVIELEIMEHNSSAGRTEQNEGLDAISISVVMPFGK